MFCTNCGKEFEGNFCPNCGTTVGGNKSNNKIVNTETGEATIIFKPTKPFLVPKLKKAMIKVNDTEKICKFKHQESFNVKSGNVNIFACSHNCKIFLFVKMDIFKIDKNIKLESGKTYEVIYKTPILGLAFISKGKLEIRESDK